jgi:hypothetical protein
MSNKKINEERDFISGLRRNYLFKNNEAALDRALNKESYFIYNELKSVLLRVLVENGELCIKDFLKNCNDLPEEKIVDFVINNFYPLKINLYTDDEFDVASLGVFDVYDADCQFFIHVNEALVKFTIDLNVLLVKNYPLESIDVSRIKLKVISKIGFLKNCDLAINFLES